jgi:tetratricopeptide (TPR) repeat protein
MTVPSVFISYSHKDEEWKDRVVTHLQVLEMEDMLNIWNDRRIEAGDDWQPEIEEALNAASIAVLLISANFLTSKFIKNEEVSRLLERRAKEGIRVIPLIIKPCAWQQVKWLTPIQGRPKDNRALSAGTEYQIDSDLAALANEIAALIKRAESISTKSYPVISPEKISLAKLPSTSPVLFGREDRLKQLDDAWNNQDINVLSLVAWGGVGKTALVNKWLLQMAKDNYRGAERVYGWSFYSQGAAEGRQVSADQFIAAALTWFGDPDPTAGSPWDKGERLADYIKQQRTLLVLDGLEPLQTPPPVETGRIKDPALTSLLRELARQNPGLVVISTRLSVDDLKDFIGSAALEIDLESLSDDAGAEYLKYLGVDGTDEERKQSSHDFGGHALALTLLGRYLKVVHDGDIRKRKEIPHVLDEQKQGKHARRIMESYEIFLKGKPELDILRLMGLFDRPAEKGALDALRKEPAIEGLTVALHKLNDMEWRYAVNNLRELRLIAPEDLHNIDELDCHPLLREHFDEKLNAENQIAWREAHRRLYEYYKSSAKELPDTLEEMTPLFAAVIHGCQAGKYQEALDEVYWKRIQRGNEYFNFNRLGAISADLSVLSGFFDPPWKQLTPMLLDSDRGIVVSIAGYELRALGRLADAKQPMQVSLDVALAQNDWANAAIRAGNLSELHTAIGDLSQALIYARQSVELADRSGDAFQRMGKRTTLAGVLLQTGYSAESEAAFRDAEEIQKLNQPDLRFLFSVSGFLYCDLLLSRNQFQEVQHRATQTLEWYTLYTFESGALSVAVGLDYISLGIAHLLQSQNDSAHPFTESLTYLNHGVNVLRQAGQQQYLPIGLLARAEFYRIADSLNKTLKDLDEAFIIATRSGMGLYLADCHLGYARLYLAKSEKNKAREHWQIAKESIEKMGYHRRDKEVQELEEQLKS